VSEKLSLEVEKVPLAARHTLVNTFCQRWKIVLGLLLSKTMDRTKRKGFMAWPHFCTLPHKLLCKSYYQWLWYPCFILRTW